MTATATTDASSPEGARRWPRQTIGFFGLLAVGCVLALTFGFHAVLHRPLLVLSRPVAQRAGLTDTATVVVRNRSSHQSYCPQVSVSALDTSGTDLEVEPATPLEGAGRIGPKGSVSYKATFHQLTAVDYRDKLDKLQGFVIRSNPCA